MIWLCAEVHFESLVDFIHWLCSHSILSSATSLPYQSCSLEKQPVPGDTGLSSDPPLLFLRGGTGGGLTPSPLPLQSPSQTPFGTLEGLLQDTPFSLLDTPSCEGPVMAAFCSEKVAGCKLVAPCTGGWGFFGLLLACEDLASSCTSSSCLSSSFTTSRM